MNHLDLHESASGDKNVFNQTQPNPEQFQSTEAAAIPPCPTGGFLVSMGLMHA